MSTERTTLQIPDVARGLSEDQLSRLDSVLRMIEADEHAPTAIRARDQAARAHVADSLVALELEALGTARQIADLGSGAVSRGSRSRWRCPRPRSASWRASAADAVSGSGVLGGGHRERTGRLRTGGGVARWLLPQRRCGRQSAGAAAGRARVRGAAAAARRRAGRLARQARSLGGGGGGARGGDAGAAQEGDPAGRSV